MSSTASRSARCDRAQSLRRGWDLRAPVAFGSLLHAAKLAFGHGPGPIEFQLGSSSMLQYDCLTAALGDGLLLPERFEALEDRGRLGKLKT